MRKSAHTVGLSAALVSLLGAVTTPASADQGTANPGSIYGAFTVEGRGSIPAPDADLLADIAMAGDGTPPAEGDFRLWQDDFSRAVAQLQGAYPESYSGSAIEDDRVWVAFADDAPAGALAILRELPGQVEVRPNVGWTEVDIVDLGEAVHYSVLNRTDVVDVSTSIDTNSGNVDVLAELDRGSSRADEHAIAATVENAAELHQFKASSDLDPIDVSVTFTTESISSDDAINGGGSMTSSTGNCTAGFSVRSSSYAHGMLTADHCPNGLSMSGTTLSYRAGSGSRDVQWHSSSAASNAQFHVGISTLRAITASYNPVSGTTVCKYGRTTGGSCDRVSLTNQCRGNYCGLYSVFQRQAAPGDSGGPWYFGNAGYGIHSGRATISGADRDVFTGLQNAASTLGVVVKLS